MAVPYNSFFEIGGHIVDCKHAIVEGSYNQYWNPSDVFVPSKAELAVAAVETVANTTGVRMPETFVRGGRIVKKAGRAQRALRAAGIAGGIAASDGPLPLGDILAIGFMTGYAGYEVYRIITD